MSETVSLRTGTVPSTVEVLGFPFHRITEGECVEYIVAESLAGRGGWVVTPNLDILRMLSTSPALWTKFCEADLIVADGTPIVWASRILANPLPERVAGSSLVSTLSARAAHAGLSVFLLGGDPGSADGAARELSRRNVDLRIAGTLCPPRGFEHDATRLTEIIERVRRARPDIVYVALGCPKQEDLIARLRYAAPRAWFLGVGISFSYLSGAVRRAPAFLRRAGLEWLFRLSQEPRRLARRYVRDDIPFALRLFGLCLRARVMRRRSPSGAGPSLRTSPRRRSRAS